MQDFLSGHVVCVAMTASRSCRVIQCLHAVRLQCGRQPHLWTLACRLSSRRCQFCQPRTVHHRFCVITTDNCSVLFNKDTFEGRHHDEADPGTCKKLCRPAPVRCSGLRPSPFHDNNRCAARRSICINVFILVQNFCVQEVVVATGGVNKGVRRS